MGLVVCLRNLQWQCLMIILILGSIARGNVTQPSFHAENTLTFDPLIVYIVYIPQSITEEKGMPKVLKYINVQPPQVSQVIGVGGGLLCVSHGSYLDVL